MTDNTNIEALPELPAPVNPTLSIAPLWSADHMREYGLLCCRAALSNAEPVAYLDIEKISNGMAYATNFKANDKQVPVFLHPSIPAPLAERKIIALLTEHTTFRPDEDDLSNVVNKWGHSMFKYRFVDFVRAIEAEHGIGLPLTNTGEQG